MSNKDIAFYRNHQAVHVDFSAGNISSDGALILLEKIERKEKLIKYFSEFIRDERNPFYVTHSVEKMLKQRTMMLMCGYEDANDVSTLQNDPLFKDVLDGDMASQPTLSRFENTFGKHDIFTLSYAWLDRYVRSLKGRKHVTVDIDATDDPTHGAQQMSMFNGYYGRFIYNELFFHDGDTGQIIIPVLRPGNSHSNRWYVSILKRVIERIRAAYPDMEISIRADSGFSCAPFYELAEKHHLKYAIGIASNDVLKKEIYYWEKIVAYLFADKGKKHQFFKTFEYRAGSWHKPQWVTAKIESTGRGMNVRFIVSNIEDQSGEQIYRDFYVKRGEHSENRIKEVKNMCFSDRLSTHGFWSNFFRLFLSCLAYEMFILLKKAIRKTKHEQAWKWQIDTIGTSLLKVGATIKVTKRRIYYQLSSAFVYQDLFSTLIRS